MRISDWSSDVCSSDLDFELFPLRRFPGAAHERPLPPRRRKRHRIRPHAQRLGPRGRPDAGGDPRKLSAGHGSVTIPEALHPYMGGITRLRSEEHTSELQSLMRISYAVFCLKKKKQYKHKP